MMISMRIASALMVFAGAINARAQAFGPTGASPTNLQRHVQFLADDALEGRGAGTRGHALAAQYVRDNFRSIGLKPILACGYLQTVPLVERTPIAADTNEAIIGQTRFELGTSVLANLSGEGRQAWTGEVVFVGYGLDGPQHGVDSYAAIDVRGKVVAYFDRAPGNLDEATAQKLIRERAAAAHARGAVGMIILVDERSYRSAWAEWQSDFASSFANWMETEAAPFRHIPMRVSAALSPGAASALFHGAPEPHEAIRRKAERGEPLPSFLLRQPVKITSANRWRRYSSSNVIGVIPGTDPTMANDHILVTAHLDHLGIDPSASGDDKIFNGALDNASGVAVAIEVGRLLAQRPMKRPVVIAAVTAEEKGLLGSDFLAERGLPGGGQVVAVINIDGGIPTYDLAEVSAMGGSHSTLGTAFDEVARKSGFRLRPDGIPPTDFFERSDHYSFARRGIPSVFITPRPNETQAATYQAHVHQPSDDLRLPFDWASGARFTDLIQRYVAAVANAPDVPAWKTDSPFLDRLDVKANIARRRRN